ncbi:unnamed protein product [Mytilus coruscus]|uniref:Tyr recombinase domain-containing protein n=1 Tax=Mytilus coruscus TaxID=42192 RepID=A0A6J8AZA4_MYTCO|nr:unnamed protein product [Mytilus coruscus]
MCLNTHKSNFIATRASDLDDKDYESVGVNIKTDSNHIFNKVTPYIPPEEIEQLEKLMKKKESDILSYFDLKPSDNDLEITRHQFRHGQPETAKSLQNKIEESVPKKFSQKYKWGYNAFNSWQAERRLRPISDNVSSELFAKGFGTHGQNRTVHFVTIFHCRGQKKKKDGGKYPSNSIYDMFSSIQGYYRHQKSSSINFFTDPEFLRARQVLDAVIKERATEGLGANTRKQADVISVDEETSLYDKGTVKRLCTSIGLTGKRTNHSLRASAATRLYNAGIEEQRVAETTGHRSNAVRVYKRTSADQQIEASNILYGLRPSDGSKKAKPSAAASAPVGSASVESSTDESDKKTVTCNFSFNFSL